MSKRTDALTAEIRSQLQFAPGALSVEGPDGCFWALLDDYDVQVHGEVPGFRDMATQRWSRHTQVLTMATDDLGSIIEENGAIVDDVVLSIEGTDFLVRDDRPRHKDDGLLCTLFLVEDE